MRCICIICVYMYIKRDCGRRVLNFGEVSLGWLGFSEVEQQVWFNLKLFKYLSNSLRDNGWSILIKVYRLIADDIQLGVNIEFKIWHQMFYINAVNILIKSHLFFVKDDLESYQSVSPLCVGETSPQDHHTT